MVPCAAVDEKLLLVVRAAPAQGISGLERFCGLLGMLRTKSARLSFVSWQLSGMRS